MSSPYIANTDAERGLMLAEIGISSLDQLFEEIPQEVRSPNLKLPPPLSELELRGELGWLARRNASPEDYSYFLGAGAYRHFIPAVVGQLASRNEFLTAYTPYQAEISQGTLQTIFEFQSLICQLTEMEVTNAGMYDGATALAEAALMACRITGRDRVAMLDSVSPRYQEVVRTYTGALGIRVDTLGAVTDGLAEDTACLLVQQPNYLGYMEDMTTLSRLAQSVAALFVVAFDPISLGMYKPPGEHGADIAVGEGQSLGNPVSFGGPYLGLFACKESHLRQMPGRLAGRTKDADGRTGYVMTLQTREQHIRRETATSNICTNQAAVALAATVYLAALGKQGLKQVAHLCYHKAHYAALRIAELPGYGLPLTGQFFKEFVVSCPRSPAEINERLLERGIIGGLDVGDLVPNGMLLCVTEMNSKEDIDGLVAALAEIGASR